MGAGDFLSNALNTIPQNFNALKDKDGLLRSKIRDIQNALDKNVGPYRHDPSREGSGPDLRNDPSSRFYEGPNLNIPNMNPAENSARTGERFGGISPTTNRAGGPNPAEQSARFGNSLGRFQLPGSSGPSIESLYEQLANSQRGGAQGRYDEVLKFLGTEGARRNTQMDSDEAAILKQLQGSDSRRRAGEDFYRDRRAGEFGELEGRMNTYQSAGSRRLIDLGIDPQLYTSAVGQQMGTLLGAQMQSGNDLMNRMAMVGAERAEGAMGRASAGMSKERRSLDASVASMMFEGSQTLSMELQSINEALMNRRIDAATAQQAIDQSTQKARQSMMQNEAIGQALGLQDGMGSVLGEQGYLGKFIDQELKPADSPEAVQIVTQDLIDQNSLPQNLIGQPMNISQLQKWANLGKTTAQTNEMTGFN